MRWRARPNVLLITIGGLRADALAKDTTPQLSAWLQSATLFSSAVSPSPRSRPAMAGVLTGFSPRIHRIRNITDRLPPDLLSLPESFRQARYRTSAVVSRFDLDHIYGLDRGFQSYDDRYDQPVVGDGKDPLHLPSLYFGDASRDRRFHEVKLRQDSIRSNAATADAALGLMQEIGNGPFFVWVDFFGAGRRWPEEFSPETLRQQYSTSLLEVDGQVARLLQGLTQLGLQRRTIVIIHGDHGQALSDHGTFATGQELYDSSVLVPLVIRWGDRLPQGRVIERPVSLLDIAPTLRELSGLARMESEGVSLASALTGTVLPPERDLYLETYLTGSAAGAIGGTPGASSAADMRKRALRGERWKLIRTEPYVLIDGKPTASVGGPPGTKVREEFYDLQSDPGERHNLILQGGEDLTRMREELLRGTVDNNAE